MLSPEYEKILRRCADLRPYARQIPMRTFSNLGPLSSLTIALVALCLVTSAAFAQADKSSKKDKTTDNFKDAVTALEITIIGGPKDKPVDNASVYLHWDETRFLRHAKQMEFDLKTDMKGVAVVKDVPRRRILIQVVKDGWRPYGRYYDLTQAAQKITIKLQSPPHWY